MACAPFSFTDDNFVRNPRHVELLERLAAATLRMACSSRLSAILDVEATCPTRARPRRAASAPTSFSACAARPGVATLYIGLESTNDAVLREHAQSVKTATASTSTRRPARMSPRRGSA
jgi:hypothetical protein